MKTANFLIVILVLTAIFFISLFLIDITYMSRKLPNAVSDKSVKTTPVYNMHPIVTTFKSLSGNLDLIYIRLKNVGVLNKDPFRFQLIRDGAVVKEINLTGYNIGDDEWVKFQFSEIPDSKNMTFEINLTSQTPSSNQAILAFVDSDGNLNYKTYSKSEILPTLKDQLTQFIIKLKHDLAFLGFYLIILTLTLIGIIKYKND